MNAYVTIRGITEEHAQTVEQLKRRFGVGTVSGAVSELLSVYPKERAKAELLQKQMAQLVRLIQDRGVALGIADRETKQVKAIDADLAALVKQIAKHPHQTRIDL